MFSLLPVTLFPLTLPRLLRSLDSFRQELAGVGAERCLCPCWHLTALSCGEAALGRVHQGISAPARFSSYLGLEKVCCPGYPGLEVTAK